MTLAHDLNQPSTEAALSVLAASGWSLNAISREWEIPYHQLYKISLAHCIDFKSKQRRQRIVVSRSELESLASGGDTMMAIAQRMGVSLPTVRRRAVQWGIGFKRGRPAGRLVCLKSGA